MPVDVPYPIRLRRRLPILATHGPVSSPVQLASAEKTRISSEGPTIRGLQVAFEETPIKLRELEAGWRARRRMGVVNGRDSGDHVPKGSQVLSRKDTGLEAGLSAILRREKENQNGNSTSGPPRSAMPRAVNLRRPLSRKDPLEIGIVSQDTLYRPRSKARPINVVGGPPLLQPSADVPLTPPPTPPAIKRPLLSNPSAAPPSVSSTQTQALLSPPTPLLSWPLSPTARPVLLTSRSRDTIHVHQPPNGFTLHLQASQTVQISQDGRTITFTSDTAECPGGAERELESSDWEKWSKADKRDWELISKLVEGYKRHATKARLYLPLGHLTITCSTPPDILLNFTHTAPKPVSSTPPRQLLPLIKVRVRLSRLEDELTIDTAASGNDERLRTKRSIKLRPQPGSSLTNAGCAGIYGYVSALKDELRSASEWGEAEREGVARLYDLGEEWGRYG